MFNILTNILPESVKTADYVTDWFPIVTDGGGPKQFFTVQGYWKAADATDGTLDIDLTINTTTADSDDAYGSGATTKTLNAAAGGFDFQVDNRGLNKWFRLRYTKNSNTTCTLYADCNCADAVSP